LYLLVTLRIIIQIMFQGGQVAAAIMIQVLVLPAMIVSQVYSKTLYADQDVRTPVRTSVISLIVASVLYLALFPFIGYLAIPVGVVISGYLKNYLLARACKHRKLFKLEKRTILCVSAFAVLSVILGVGLWFAPIHSMISLVGAVGIFGILYLPIAYLISKKI